MLVQILSELLRSVPKKTRAFKMKASRKFTFGTAFKLSCFAHVSFSYFFVFFKSSFGLTRACRNKIILSSEVRGRQPIPDTKGGLRIEPLYKMIILS